MKKIIISLYSSVVVSFVANAAELSHPFSSPAFSGQGYSSHVLTIKQLEDQAKAKNQATADALKAKAESDAANTPQARFLANIESRIYAQLAKQITDSLFSTDGAPSCTSADPYNQCGAVNIAGNDISWRLGNPSVSTEAGMIVITIAGASGDVTMKVPSGTFYF
jgi:hypothetical protein